MRQALENAWLIVPIDSPRFLGFVFSRALRAGLSDAAVNSFRSASAIPTSFLPYWNLANDAVVNMYVAQ